MSEVVALDLGTAHVGVAVGDRSTRMAFARPALDRTSDEQLLEAVVELVRAEGARELVVGLPLTLSNDASAQTHWTERFAARLRERIAIPVRLVDERLSSAEARRGVRGTGEHSEAARIVLESYLRSA